MRRARPLLAALLLAGCVGPAPPEPTPAPSCPPIASCTLPIDAPAASSVGAPDLPAGLALTFAGEQVWNPDKAFTVVVAKADASGYLFAGAAEDDVAYAAAWGDKLFGPHARDLNPEGSKSRWFQWPLADGATWELRDGFTLRATAADVRAPSGSEPGFVVEGATETARLRYEYAPSVGFVTRWLYESRGRVMEDLRLESVARSASWVWFEPLAGVAADDPAAPAAMDLPAGADAVILSAGGAGGGRATVTMPDGSARAHEFPGDASVWQGAWTQEILPPLEGAWTASVVGSPGALPAGAPVGWAYVVLAPVQWVRG